MFSLVMHIFSVYTFQWIFLFHLINGTFDNIASTFLCLVSMSCLFDSASDFILLRYLVPSSVMKPHSFSNCFFNPSVCSTDEGKHIIYMFNEQCYIALKFFHRNHNKITWRSGICATSVSQWIFI